MFENAEAIAENTIARGDKEELQLVEVDSEGWRGEGGERR
jgi:hypothetical protein